MADNKVKVTITDQAGGKNVQAELPNDAPMSRLIPALVKRMALPEGNRYVLQHKQSGKQLGQNDTLATAGVKADDTLRILPDVTAG